MSFLAKKRKKIPPPPGKPGEGGGEPFTDQIPLSRAFCGRGGRASPRRRGPEARSPAPAGCQRRSFPPRSRPPFSPAAAFPLPPLPRAKSANGAKRRNTAQHAQKKPGRAMRPGQRSEDPILFLSVCVPFTFRMRSCSRRAGHSAYSAVMPAIDWASSSSALMLSSPSSASTSLTQATISASPFLQATQLPLLSYSMPMSAMTRSSCTAA